MGFVGVLLIVGPGGGLSTLALAVALVVAGANSAYSLLSRVLASTESTLAMLVWAAGLGTAIYGGYALATYRGPSPGTLDLSLMLASSPKAYREAPASVLAPLT